MKHAGCGWPNGAVDNGAILALPSSELLMLSTEARYHYDAAVRAGKRCVWRAIPRIGKRPAELGWSPARFVAETINLTDAPSEPITDFIPWNELDLSGERGDGADDWSNLAQRYALIGGWSLSVVQSLKQWSPETRIHWGAWTPDHDALGHIGAWGPAADLCDVIDFHAYDNLENIQRQYGEYRGAFPGKPLMLTEWHCKGDLDEERRVLAWLAETMTADPLFEAAHFFIWRWHNAPGWWSDAYDIEHNPDRHALFMNPPTVAEPEEPVEPEEPEMPDPYEFWSAERIAEVTNCPVEAVRAHWPRVVEQLHHCGLNEQLVQVAMIGTVAIETASTFAPVREAFWLSEEWRQANLRYYPFFGRGFIQLTWESNYRTYGPKIAELWGTSPDQPDFDLVGNPDLALNPDIAAAVAALYFRDHAEGGIPVAARRGDWRECRRLVQGGTDGLDRLTTIAAALTGQAPQVLTERYYGADVPDAVIRQQNSWTCAVRSTYAALWAMAQQGHGPAVTYGDGGPRDIYEWMVPTYDAPNVGLLDHTGAGLAVMLRSHGYAATSYYPVTLATVRELAGAQPCLVGGDGWNHWAMVRGRTNDGGLILENPSPGHANINDYLRDSWDRLGPMALVTIDLVPVIEPVEPSDEQPTYEQLANLEGVSYHDDGVVIPALEGAKAAGDWSQVDAVVSFLRANDPHRAA